MQGNFTKRELRLLYHAAVEQSIEKHCAPKVKEEYDAIRFKIEAAYPQAVD